jgi:tripartite-type tricarboxylate transporter receptor subunit TctC
MGVVGPARLPQEITMRLNKEINELVAEPAVIEKIRALGSEPKAGPPENFTKRIATDIARWNKVIDEAKIERI